MSLFVFLKPNLKKAIIFVIIVFFVFYTSISTWYMSFLRNNSVVWLVFELFFIYLVSCFINFIIWKE